MTPDELSDIIDEGTIAIHKLWDLDALGITPEDPKVENQITQEYFKNTVKYNDNQHWVILP